MTFTRMPKDQARGALATLIEQYHARASELEASGSRTNEAEIRAQFVDPFLVLLGWDVRNDEGLPHRGRHVVLEQSMSTDNDVTGRPDYRLRTNGRDRLPVEAKRPNDRIANHAEYAHQARAYGWSLSLPASMLTNFAETRIFDTSNPPDPSDSADVAVIPGCYFTVNDYLENFDELWRRLSWESVASDSFFSVYEFTEPPRGQSPFDESFLHQFRSWRRRLAQSIASHNAELGAPEVGRRTQKILNALLFLRVCEDRNISRYEGLLQSSEHQTIVESFREADNTFNAGLFTVIDTTVLAVPVLAEIIREMYWPRSKFAFGVLEPRVLASLYEQYLAEHLDIDHLGRVSLVEKAELVHAGGIATTPEFVIEDLVSAVLEDVQDDQIGGSEPYTVADLACGSGAFLVELLQSLLERLARVGRPADFEMRSSVAKSHLFGVDIDGAAVEVAKLSVLLVVLGDETEVQNTYRLPSLADNFVTGNSLIRTDFDALVPGHACVPEVRSRAAPIDLARSFKAADGDLVFDAIVGNPPYIRIQTLAEYFPEQLEYFQHSRSGYRSSQAHSFDVYMLFIERALSLMKQGGRLALIVPNRFTTGLAGVEVRSQLGPRLIRMVHFGVQQVFENRLTYTALIVAGDRDETAEAVIDIVDDLDAWKLRHDAKPSTVSRTALTAEPWTIASADAARVFAAMDDASIGQLGDERWCEIFVGVQTSADGVYFISPKTEGTSDDFYYFSDSDGIEWSIERDICRNAILNRTIEQYDSDLASDYCAIFPYRIEEATKPGGRKRAVPLSPGEMASSYPRAFEYLTARRGALQSRSVSPDPGESFWAYGRSQSITKMTDPKIIARVMSTVPRYALDERGLIVPGGGDGGPYYVIRAREGCRYSHRVIMAVLSHPAVDAYVASHGKSYQGSYIVHRKAFLKSVPIPDLHEVDQDKIEACVREMQDIAVRRRAERDSAILSSLDARWEYLKAETESVVARGYGLSGEQVSTIVD